MVFEKVGYMRSDSETVRNQAFLHFSKLALLYFVAQKNLHFQNQMFFGTFAEVGGKGHKIMIKAGFPTILFAS